HILNNRQGKKVAVIVNDMSDINIDAATIKNDVSLNHSNEKLVEMSNGCICCSLREDLLVEVGKLAKDGRFDYLVIESTGISEPLPVAETFTFADENGVSLGDIATLDTMVTVVDAVNFLNDYEQANDLQDTGESLGEDDERSVADLLVDQVEFADVILISKTDLITNDELNKLTAILNTLNTQANIIPISNGHININEVLNTGLFNFERAQQAPGWLKEMRGEHIPETEEYGISSFNYTARRPFDPEKFYNFLHSTEQFGKLIRSKGYFWLATRPLFCAQWSQAGGIAHYGFAGMFFKAIPQKDWPTEPELLADINNKWVEPFGDMRQELVFIGQSLNKQAMIKALDDCLLPEDVVLKGKDFWRTYNDPFPIWEEE
ncbi:zinc metallochaperone GTPase ZigA, partial [Pseudoalteromonas sp. SR45-5]|uniref:zinc metallochaperone GTPase ZigA n=1 Tax=Pseudoalteromonas sp. SR45-5 TaxID=2760928 RepID=UPI0015FD2B4C